MKTEELLKAGIEAARGGDLDRAAAYLAHVVQLDPTSLEGWYLLSTCVAEPERRVYCLRRVLALNPNHPAAQDELDRLLAPLPPSVHRTATPPVAEPEATPPPSGTTEGESAWMPLQWPSAPPETQPEIPPVAQEPSVPAEPIHTADEPAATIVPEEQPPFWAEIPGTEGDEAATISEEESSEWSPFPSEESAASAPLIPAEAEEDLLRPFWLEAESEAGQAPPFSRPEDVQRYLAAVESEPPKPAAPIGPSIETSPSQSLGRPRIPKAGAAPAAMVSTPPEPHAEVRPAAPPRSPVLVRKQKKSGALLLVIIGLVLLVLCAAGVAILYFSGSLASILSPTQIPIPTALLMPAAPSAASAASPAAATAAATTAPPTTLPTPLPTVGYIPTFESAACQFEAPQGANVTCGYLTVPENRAGDPSHTIRLAVAVYHSSSSNPATEPVLFLQGGPGGEAVKLSAQAYSTLVQPFLKERDFIAYDQRGTGLSEPALECPDLTKAYLQDIYGQIPADTRKIVYSNAFLSCQGQMSVGGIDLNAYTTAASAADVKDLLQTLKYPQVDLYGASYGTRLAQVIMRDDPEIVHAAILDSVVPIETNSFANYPESIQGALKALFDLCAADPGCNAAYPNLQSAFWDEVNKLDANPVTISVSDPRTGKVTGQVNGSVFLNVVLMSLKMSDLIETAPQTIYRFKAGDYSTVIAAQDSMPYAFQGISVGLFVSMMCHEQILETTTDQLQAAMAAPAQIQEYAWLPFFGNAQDVYRTCQSWRAEGPRLGENDPVSSDIPTLIITGKFDPTTPPQYAQLVASHLTHSYYFEFPNQGHTPTASDASGCAMDTAVAFLTDPQVEPDRSCLNAIRPVSFIVPYTGNPAAELTTVHPSGLSARVPNGWLDVGEGFYLRASSPFDVTQIGIFQVPGTTSADLVQWLSQKAWGFRGLDTAPVWAGQRQSNGLNWTLYTSTSLGRPADIGMADHNGDLIVVLAFSNLDEHDAFYRTIFLPAVDSIRP